MHKTLLLTIHFHDGRYHGVPEWPPSPARVFQALVAGAARGNAIADPDQAALTWLEGLPSGPVIVAPPARRGQMVKNYVPNNDLDAVGHNPQRVNEIRAGKVIRPMIFDGSLPLLYMWRFEASDCSDRQAETLCSVAEGLFQLGRGADMAWALGEVLSDDHAQMRARDHSGPTYLPSTTSGGVALSCPGPGSLESLIKRHREERERLTELREPRHPATGAPSSYKVAGTTFRHPSKARFRQVAYNCPPELLSFDLRRADGGFLAWPQTRIVELALAVRDAAAARLKGAYGRARRADLAAKVEPVFIGRHATDADKAERVRIVPLPSIGNPHVTRAIRRLLVEVPPNCPIPAGEIEWAFSGLQPVDPDTGEVSDLWRLTPAEDRGMQSLYGVAALSSATLWRSVTPLALPESARRRRIDPRRLKEEAKTGSERCREEHAAAAAVAAALRHAGIETAATVQTVRRDPFNGREARADAFSAGTRFDKERLWHAEIRFMEPVSGPLVIGDGRYQGLGLMAPVRGSEGLLAFKIESGLTADAPSQVLARALRRAVLARVQSVTDGKLPLYFSGHAEDGGKARSGSHEHLAFIHDPDAQRFLIIAPHALERRSSRGQEAQNWTLLERAMTGFSILRAGKAGILSLSPLAVDKEADPLFAPARMWRSLTPFDVTRHRRLSNPAAAIAADVELECLRLGLPKVRVEADFIPPRSGRGLSGIVRLHLSQAVLGPILIGRSRHFGGGLFSSSLLG